MAFSEAGERHHDNAGESRKLSAVAAGHTIHVNRLWILQKNLYERLGGYDSIAAVVNDFMGLQFAHKQVGRFYVGHSTKSKTRLRQLITEMLCEVTGGPAEYIGRDLRTAHAGLGITGGDWQAAVKNLTAALDKFKVPQKEKDELLAIVAGLSSIIVEI